MSVKVKEKHGKLYLVTYQNGIRKSESLHLELTDNKIQNKRIWRLAYLCRSNREIDIFTDAWNINNSVSKKIFLLKYMQDYAMSYKNKSAINSCIKHVKDFSLKNIQLSQITSNWIENFQQYLLTKNCLSDYSVSFYIRILSSILNKAVLNGIIPKNPARFVSKVTYPEADMIFLSAAEVQSLANRKINNFYGAEVRRAFLFICHTGLRISDIETLTWSKIQGNPMQIIKTQEKTKNRVFIPLSKSAIKMISDGKKHLPNELVFKLSIHNRRASYNHLKKWAKAAGIMKKIGWHTARRTFATLALENGADIVVLAKLLGHSDLSNVTQYAKVTDKLCYKAICALPDIEL